jgi:hypothetical protein
LKDFGKVVFSFRISHCAFGIFSGEAVVEGVLEADELAEEGFVAAVGVRGFLAEEMVELNLGIETVGCGLEEARALQTRPCDLDETALDTEPTGARIFQTAANEFRTGKLVEEGGGHGGLEAVSRKTAKFFSTVEDDGGAADEINPAGTFDAAAEGGAEGFAAGFIGGGSHGAMSASIRRAGVPPAGRGCRCFGPRGACPVRPSPVE